LANKQKKKIIWHSEAISPYTI